MRKPTLRGLPKANPAYVDPRAGNCPMPTTRDAPPRITPMSITRQILELRSAFNRHNDCAPLFLRLGEREAQVFLRELCETNEVRATPNHPALQAMISGNPDGLHFLGMEVYLGSPGIECRLNREPCHPASTRQAEARDYERWLASAKSSADSLVASS